MPFSEAPVDNFDHLIYTILAALEFSRAVQLAHFEVRQTVGNTAKSLRHARYHSVKIRRHRIDHRQRVEAQLLALIEEYFLEPVEHLCFITRCGGYTL